jgi:hypothetical protein
MEIDDLVEVARETHKAFVKACVMSGHASYREEDAWRAALLAVIPAIRGKALEEAAEAAESRFPEGDLLAGASSMLTGTR